MFEYAEYLASAKQLRHKTQKVDTTYFFKINRIFQTFIHNVSIRKKIF